MAVRRCGFALRCIVFAVMTMYSIYGMMEDGFDPLGQFGVPEPVRIHIPGQPETEEIPPIQNSEPVRIHIPGQPEPEEIAPIQNSQISSGYLEYRMRPNSVLSPLYDDILYEF
ncbi:uncharacterized protein LOC133199911 isoform X1 [Saccostrea echinata]|uniref:uncharacterized protein LOC133192604 isoform X1 n=1 Tax=Saccostrea echinata TaxID=191078 RepID=UPI002A82D6D9|nr:uncharacterized protein LOC133192604 isoform X1 [Saccostrea echinata]XP_061191702.1 uncharacterized protein LOC133199911 isoform X1 [Saccostrea echinata]